MDYVSRRTWEQLQRLIELKNLGNDLFDTATIIKENENGEFDELNKFIDNQTASGETVQLEILNYIHFCENSFEQTEPKYFVHAEDNDGFTWTYYFNEYGMMECVLGAFDSKYDFYVEAFDMQKETAEKLAEVVGGEIVEAKEQ